MKYLVVMLTFFFTMIMFLPYGQHVLGSFQQRSEASELS